METVGDETVRCKGDLPNCFRGELGTHGAGKFVPRERGRIQVLDDGEQQLELMLFVPLDHRCCKF